MYEQILDQLESKKEGMSMDDYIKREDVEKVLRDAHINRPLDSDRWVIAQMSEGVAKIPAADVRENVRGIWNNALDFSNGNEDLECSVCGEWFFSYKIDCDWNFCPNCGADMRGEKYV